ncbi:hypothetical protein J6524_09795 [Bradyrhizobium sp. WSM 1738]|uniref:hypothetical protein n=1 Tax=Bradyrhizobium hereditatis TaxID=2821405 RepID=UPI001CE27C10|nr:hypothetical protein [Bradyrhizobium hereditatis]MCA6115192.1 hypothetical protein [Bradyrhizobium hereditatis]
MARQAGSKDIELTVETVFNVLSMLEREGALKAFADECEAKGLKLKVTPALYALGRAALGALPGVEAAGPDCPACPPRR